MIYKEYSKIPQKVGLLCLIYVDEKSNGQDENNKSRTSILDRLRNDEKIKNSNLKSILGDKFGWKDRSKAKGRKDMKTKSEIESKDEPKDVFKGFMIEHKNQEKDESEISFGQHNMKGTDIIAMVKTYLEVLFQRN